VYYKLTGLSVADAATVSEIEQQCHEFPMSQKMLETCFGRFYHVVGVELDDELKGFAIMHMLFEDATLMDICVLPQYQGKGFGKFLLGAIIEIAVQGGAERVMLEVRASSDAVIAFYKATGFEQTGTRPNYYQHKHGKEDAILMERLL
jgi:ribosomal-protein-alanine N-acetyltransferase